MADFKEIDFNSANNCSWIRAIDENGNSIKISKDDFMKLFTEISLAFKISAFPYAGSNIVGNHDGYDSGYGWYNNNASGSDEFAPGGSAGVFIRFKANVTPITFFMVTFGAYIGQLWWRPDGGTCSKIV
jgi:hypothetical protein